MVLQHLQIQLFSFRVLIHPVGDRIERNMFLYIDKGDNIPENFFNS